ncbi:hypothetical protein EBZ39_09420, partial [bacterium]|nr:hypothetical protein [bacterium]
NLALGQERFARDYLPDEMAGIPSEAPTEPSRPTSQRLEDLSKAIEKNKALINLVGAGATGITGILKGRQAARQAKALEAELKQPADFYRQQGRELYEQGMRGELTASQRQEIERQRAAGRQRLAASGQTSGTAALQEDIRLAELGQRLAQTNVDRGLQLINVADTIVQNAIRAGYQADLAGQQNANKFFTAMAPFLVGVTSKTS